MAFTVRDFHDLVKLLSEHPEWREELRALLLTPEILSMPQLLRELGEKVDRLAAAHLRAEERLSRLEERFSRLEEKVAELAEAQIRAEERLSRLEERVAELAEAQIRTEERLARLGERVAELVEAQIRAEERLSRLEERVAELVEAHLRAEKRLSRLEERVAELAEAQIRAEERLSRLEERVAELAEAQARTEKVLAELAGRMTTLVEAQRRTEADVADLKGMTLELRYRDRAPAYFAKILRRARLLSDSELMELLDSEKAREALSEEEREDLLLADLILWGRRKSDDAEVYLVGEVSWVVDCGDVERARRRADLLGRLGVTTIPVVAGRTLTEEADQLAREKKVLRFLDGGFYYPN